MLVSRAQKATPELRYSWRSFVLISCGFLRIREPAHSVGLRKHGGGTALVTLSFMDCHTDNWSERETPVWDRIAFWTALDRWCTFLACYSSLRGSPLWPGPPRALVKPTGVRCHACHLDAHCAARPAMNGSPWIGLGALGVFCGGRGAAVSFHKSTGSFENDA